MNNSTHYINLSNVYSYSQKIYECMEIFMKKSNKLFIKY